MDYNNPETWLTAEIHNPPPFDTAKYQARIDDICGRTLSSGKSNILLVWMPSMENYNRYYSEWDKAGFGTKTVLRGQYVYDTLHDPAGNPIDVPPPRWAFKQYEHGVRYAATDNLTRWLKKQVGKQVLLRENRPPHPVEGRYIPFISIGKHTGKCCRELKKMGLTCWGDYREPDESYLEILRRAVQERERSEDQRPDEPLSVETFKRAASEALAEQKRKEAAQSERMKNYIDAHLPEMVARYTGDETFLEKQKEYSLPEKRTEAGLIIPC